MKKIVGMWNPSVILTYVGMAFAVLGMGFAFLGEDVAHPMICLIIAGVCDLFDGAVARRCKRTEEEKAFGIELDSLVDVLSFIALPITIFLAMGFTGTVHLLLYVLYALAGIARLGYFNLKTADAEGPVPYYLGLPVTYAALIFPVAYLLNGLLGDGFVIFYSLVILAVTVLEVLMIKIKKPRGIAYAIFALLAVGMILYYFMAV